MDKPYKPKFHVYPGKSDLGGGSKNVMGKTVTESSIPTVNSSTMTTSTTSVIQAKTLNSGGSNFVVSDFVVSMT